MFTECALRHSPSPTMLIDKTTWAQKLARSLPLRLDFPRRFPEKIVDGKAFASFEYQASRKSNESDLVQLKLHTGTTAANGGAQTQSEGTRLNPATENAKVSEYSASEDRRKCLEALAGLRQGRLIDDGKVFQQTFVVRFYEANFDRKVSLDTVINFFLEATMNHWPLLGLVEEGFAGATPLMSQHRLTWVITKYHIEVQRYPTWPEAVVVDTWKDSSGKHGVMVDWLLREHQTGEILARGTSSWAIMNQDTRRLSKMPDDVRTEIEPSYVTDKRRAVAESTSERIPKLDKTAKITVPNLIANKTDLDGNDHVNNVAIVRWVMESIPKKTWDTHELRSISLEFRRECKEGDVVESLTNLEESDLITNSSWSPVLPISLPPANDSAPGNGSLISSNGNRLPSANDNDMACSSDDVHFIHQIRMQAQGEEIVRGRTIWKRRPQIAGTM